MKIDTDAKAELEGFIKKLPGLINVGLDGATVNGKQKVSPRAFICIHGMMKHSTWLADFIYSLERRVFHLLNIYGSRK